jgi:uncharacterized membrane protein
VHELRLSAEPDRPRLDVLDWSLRIALALAFVYFGADKFNNPRMWIRLFDQIGFGQWFRYATGLVEVLGGVLLLIPPATLLAVVLLLSAMLGAILVHVFVVGLGPQTVIVTVLASAVFFIGWRRRAARDTP